jgi:BMFP domain-containing protein YqiC
MIKKGMGAMLDMPKWSSALLSDLKVCKKALEKNLHEMLQGFLAKEGFVIFEEFKTQREILAQMSKKVEALQAEVTALRQQEDKKDPLDN